MTNLSKGTLRAYEVLKAFSDGTGNKIDALVNFLRPSISDFDGQVIDFPTLAGHVNKQLHISISPDALEEISKELEKKGWIRLVSTGTIGNNFQVTCSSNAIPVSNSEIIDIIIPKFKEFLTTYDLPDDFSYTDDDLFEMLSEFIISVENIDDLNDLSSIDASGLLNDQRNYLCSRFIHALNDEDNKYSKIFSDLAKIALISDLVREFAKPVSTVRNTKAFIYLDSPLLLELTGVSGKLSQDNVLKLISIARKKGASIRTFEISINEAINSLKAVLNEPEHSRYGPTHDAMLRGEVERPYVLSVIANIDKILSEEFDVKITKKTSSNSFFAYRDYDKLKNDLQNVYSGQLQGSHRAAHDAQAVASIMRLRLDQFQTNDLWEAGHFFLTRNRRFKDTARAFCLANRSYGGSGDFLLFDDDVGPVVDIREFASSMWLRFGSGEAEDIPRLHLLAGCERILRFNKKSLTKVKELVNKLNLDPGANEHRVEQIRIMLMNPVGSMSIQDQLRGSNREANYQSMLDAQSRAEELRISKGIEKGKAHFQAEAAALKKEAEAAKGDREEARKAAAKAKRDRERVEAESKKDKITHTKEKWRIISELIQRVDGDINHLHNRQKFRIWVYRMVAILCIFLVVLTEKLIGYLNPNESLFSFSIPFSNEIIITPLEVSVVFTIIILLPFQHYIGIISPKLDLLRDLVYDSRDADVIADRIEGIEATHAVDIGVSRDKDFSFTKPELVAIESSYMARHLDGHENEIVISANAQITTG